MTPFIIGEAPSRDSPPDAHRGLNLLNIQARACLTGFLSLDMVGGVPGLPGAPHGLCFLCRSRYVCIKMLQTAQQHQIGLAPAERKEALRGG